MQDTIFEILPHRSSQIISVGLSEELNNCSEETIVENLKKVYSKNNEVYKILFKSFSNNTFIFREHYSLEINDKNISETVSVLKLRKENIKTNMDKFFKLLERKKIDIKLTILYGLTDKMILQFEDELQREKFENIIDDGAKYKIFFRSNEICILSTLKWVNTGSHIMDYIYSFHKEFSKEFNPVLTENKVQQFNNFNDFKRLLINADQNLRIYTETRVDFPLKSKTEAIKSNLLIPYLLSFPAIVIIFIFCLINSFVLGTISSIFMMISMIGTIYVLTTRGN